MKIVEVKVLKPAPKLRSLRSHHIIATDKPLHARETNAALTHGTQQQR